MSTHSYQNDLKQLERHYAELLRQAGDTPQAVQWRDQASQERRFEILTQIGLPKDATILDFGCGTGHLLEYLQRERQFAGQYTGYDVTQEMIAAAQKKFPGVRFKQCDIFSEGVEGEFDYIFISGVFNNAITDNEKFLRDTLSLLFPRTRRLLAFNALSAYVDFFDEGLYYFNPENVFRFCKEALSPLVTLRHDYLIKTGAVPYEFTIYIHRCELKPRAALKK